MRKKYFSKCRDYLASFREMTNGIILPVDKLRLDLDENWPGGTKLLEIESSKFYAGMCRIFKPGSYAEPHNDSIARDLLMPNSFYIQNQLACNIYLKVPKIGGELMLWDDWPTNEEYKIRKKVDSYGVSEDTLLEPSIKILPEEGDLVMFNSTRIHSVKSIIKGERFTSTAFVGLNNKDNSLNIWS